MLTALVGRRRRPANVPQFRARNGIITDPAGQEFVPLGANVGSNNAFDWRGTATGHAADAVAWGWNFIRLNILSTDNISYSWLASNPTQGMTGFLNYLDTIVKEYTAQGIVVQLAPHDDPKASGFVQSAYEAEMAVFWEAAALKWKNNPYVWYNPINEPRYANQEWVAFHDLMCSKIRNAGARAPITLDAPGAGQDTGPLSWVPGGLSAKFAYEPDMAPYLNSRWGDIIISCHNYGAKWDTNAKVSTWVANHRAVGVTPMFGEFGYTIDGSSTAGSYDANYQAAGTVFWAYEQLGVGALWWHATHGDNYALKLNGNAFWSGGPGAGLSEAGQRMWNLSHQAPPPAEGSAIIPQTIPFLIGVS